VGAKANLLWFRTVHPTQLQSHVSPVFPDGPPDPQTLSVSARSVVPFDGQVRPAAQPEELVQPPVQHAPRAAGGCDGDVGCCEFPPSIQKADDAGYRAGFGKWEEASQYWGEATKLWVDDRAACIYAQIFIHPQRLLRIMNTLKQLRGLLLKPRGYEIL
jgi:hypothetical protein